MWGRAGILQDFECDIIAIHHELCRVVRSIKTIGDIAAILPAAIATKIPANY